MDIDKAVLIQVICTTIARRGRGISDDPIRVVTQYWSTSGELLAEIDQCPHARTIDQDMADQMLKDMR